MTKTITDYFQGAVLQEISPIDIQKYFVYLRTEHKSKIHTLNTGDIITLTTVLGTRTYHYEMYLHDIRAFNTAIHNFIRYMLSKLETNSPENYAAALYEFYNDQRLAEKLLPKLRGRPRKQRDGEST